MVFFFFLPFLARKLLVTIQGILGSCIIQVYKPPEQGIASGGVELSAAKPDCFRRLGFVPGEHVSLPGPTLHKPAAHQKRLVTKYCSKRAGRSHGNPHSFGAASPTSQNAPPWMTSDPSRASAHAHGAQGLKAHHPLLNKSPSEDNSWPRRKNSFPGTKEDFPATFPTQFVAPGGGSL